MYFAWGVALLLFALVGPGIVMGGFIAGATIFVLAIACLIGITQEVITALVDA